MSKIPKIKVEFEFEFDSQDKLNSFLNNKKLNDKAGIYDDLCLSLMGDSVTYHGVDVFGKFTRKISSNIKGK